MFSSTKRSSKIDLESPAIALPKKPLRQVKFAQDDDNKSERKVSSEEPLVQKKTSKLNKVQIKSLKVPRDLLLKDA